MGDRVLLFMALMECMDVGGTSTRYALIQDEHILYRETLPSLSGDFSALTRALVSLSVRGRKSVGSPRVDHTVIGLPGPVHEDILLNSAPLGLSLPTPLAPLRAEFDSPVRIANDLNLAVQAELRRGIGRTVDSFYLLTLSTGIGTGLVWKGQVFSGPMGEFGHCVLDAHAPHTCALNHRGCWSSFSSGAGMQRAAEHVRGSPSPLDIFSLASTDRAAHSIVARARRANAHGIGTMLNAFGVDHLVVMGSVGLSQFEKIIPTKSEIEPFTLHPVPPITPTKLGDDIGLWGAYYAGLATKK